MPRKKKPRGPRLTAKQLLTEQRIAADQQRDALHETAHRITTAVNVKANVRVETNEDGTVDGWLMISDIPKRMRTISLFLKLEGMIQIPNGHWLSVGGAISQRTEKEVEREIAKRIKAGQDPEDAQRAEKRRYNRFKGLDRVNAFPQSRRTKSNYKADNFHTARRIFEQMEKKRRHKTEMVLIKLFWNHENIKPWKAR